MITLNISNINTQWIVRIDAELAYLKNYWML